MGIFDKAKDALADNQDEVQDGLNNAVDDAEDRTVQPNQIDSSADIAQADDYLGSRDEAKSIPDPTQSHEPPVGSPEPPD